MSFIDRLLAFVDSLTPGQLALGFALLSMLLLVVEERRVALVALLGQYILIGLMIGAQIYHAITLVWIGLGLAICLMLYVTARHVQRGLRRRGLPSEREFLDHPSILRVVAPSMGTIFRLVVAILGGFVAYGVWRSYPLPGVPAELTFTAYWLIPIGLLTMLTSADPLRMGLGLLTFVNGFEAIYFFLERSLVVITLLGVVSTIMALGIAVMAESWLGSLQEEATG